MITVNNVALPEVTADWLMSHYAAPIMPRQPIEALLQSQPPAKECHRGVGCNHNFDLGPTAYQTTKYRISGRMIYAPGGYMDWHTNGDWPGLRMYAAWSENGSSGMLWYRDGRTVVDYDSPGWNIRTFTCPEWHAVFAKCWRVSIGWHLQEKPHEVENLV